ncbi:MAG TPA: acyl-CoA dehydrogenase family protein, partial [Solirubrobacteraceae bacterium]|nr:acyl-CoA dehydrogenase family protein [Solirubrobacteraceae bacterium]
MDFDLTPDQREIKHVARELLAARSPMARVRDAAESASYDQDLWAELVQLGWPGIAVARHHGGQELGAIELAVLCEELGYACAATPFLSTATAAAVIQAAGSHAQRDRWLPGLASGE